MPRSTSSGRFTPSMKARKRRDAQRVSRAVRIPVAATTAALMAMFGLPFVTQPTTALAAPSCPAGTTAQPFTWQGAGTGNQAVWSGGDDGYTQSYTIGTGATQVTMTMKMIDPQNRNADANHRFTQAPYAGLNLFSSLQNVVTKSNGAYGAGWLTFGIGTLNSGEGATLSMSFDKPVIIRDYVVGDIDFTGYDTTINNEPEASYQDQVELRTQRGGADIPFTVTPLAAGKTTTTGQTVAANYQVGVKGDLNPADPLGSVAINTAEPITSFTTKYTNGPLDATGEQGRPAKSYLPAGSSGVSDSQAIRISGFTLCVGTGSIGDTIYRDNNGDGTQAPNEGGIAGVTVYAKDPTGNIMGTAVTDANGKYTFDKLPPFTYTIEVDKSTLPPDVITTPTGDPDPTKDAKATVPVTGGAITNIDFGFVPTRIAGFVYEDVNNDGTKAAGETPIAGTKVELLNSVGAVVATTTTAADGSYEFVGMAPGTYTVRETQPSGYLDGKDTAGSNGAALATNDRITVTLAAGQQSTNNNFGELKAASISGTVYADTNNDGSIGATGSEPRLAGVTVTLLDSAGATVATTTTRADGTYSFTNLAPGSYTVVETQPSGYADGIDTPGSGTTSTPSNDRIAVTLNSNQASAGNNFGELPASISGTVFHDATNAGVKDASDPRISGVTIQLLDSTGAVIGTTTTDANGNYSFTGLAAGNYKVREVQPAAYGDSVELPGSGNTTPSNDVIAVTLTAGQSSTANDFAEVKGSISGSVYDDANNDGTKDTGEAAISGVTVKLFDGTGALVATTTTATDGSYSFNNLVPGTYRVEEAQPSGFGDGKDTAGTGTASVPSNDKITVTLTSSSLTSSGNNFGERTPGTAEIRGTVWWDKLFDNGVQNSNPLLEPPLAGVKLTLLDSAGNVVATTTTDSNGDYAFTGLYAGTYRVVETQPAGYLDGKDRLGATGSDPLSPLPDEHAGIVLAAGQIVDEVNFAELAPDPNPATISGTVYVDTDNNGIAGTPATEPRLAGVTVSLYEVTTGDFIASAVTDSNGNYSFTGLPAGQYRIEESQPANYTDGIDTPGSGTTSTTTNDQILVTVAANGTSTGNNFGERPGTISGTVFVDSDNSGTRGPLEPKIGGVTVTLLDASGAVVATTTSDATTGAYSFTNLPAGNYTVVETQPSAYADGQEIPGTGNTSPSNDRIGVSLGAGASSTGNDFGELPGIIRGSVYIDADNNGAKTSGESPIATVTVKLVNPTNGSTIATTQTDSTGAYEFLNVPAGNYWIVESQPSGYVDAAETAGTFATNTSTNDRIAVALPAGGVSSGNDFGEKTLVGGSISGNVYSDANGDGIKSTGEPAIGSVTVELWDLTTNSMVASTTSDPTTGAYTFSSLPPGNYEVRETQPTSYADGAETPGTGTATAATSTTNDRIRVTLANGENSVGNDFGETAALISGFVYAETDNDGVKETGETNLSGVTVELRTTAGVLVATATTDAAGFYEFRNVPAGTYNVVELQPSAYQDGKEAPGTGTTSSTVNDQIRVTVQAGGSSINNNFAEIPPAVAPVRIAGSVWIDRDNDGVIDAGELPLPGTTITLLDQSGNVVATATTKADGTYEFRDLPAGTYSVVETQPAGYSDGRDSVGTAGATSGGNDRFTVTLAPGAESTQNNFGELAARVSGTVYVDANNDGTYTSATETPIGGTTVQLLDPNGAVVATTTTATNGTYAFEDLIAGTYRVVETQPAAYSDGKDTAGTGLSGVTANDQITVSLPAGGASTENNFGERTPTTPGSISGYVYVDSDASLGRTVGEPGIGTTLTLVDSNGDVVATTTSNPTTGAYTFANIPAGTYTVVESQPASYLDSAETAGTGASIPASSNDRIQVVLPSGGASVDNNFGENAPAPSPATISGTVFVDKDRSNTVNSADAALPGVTIILLNSSGVEVSRAVTDASGNYSFTGLPAGSYTIVEEQPTKYGDGVDLPGTNGATSLANDRIAVTVTAGQTSTANNFGEVLGSISGQIFVDTNDANGRDGSEPAIAGVTVKLLDAQGNVVATTTSAADGSYSFLGLTAGTYRVQEVQPSVYDDGTDYPGNASTASLDDVFTVSLPAGAASTGNDFGEKLRVLTGSISGAVYADANNDGVKDSGEASVAGATVQLLDVSGNIVATALTGPDGSYVFAGLPAGDYTVVEVQPTGYTDGKDSPGTGTTSTSLNDRIKVTLTPGASSTANNFGEIPPAVVTSSISGFVYVDAANDGLRTGDAPLAGVEVKLYDQSGSLVATSITDATGAYNFPNLAPGSYRVEQTQPAGYLDGMETPGNGAVKGTANDTIVVSLTSGMVSTENNFGERPPAVPPATISGTVFREVDGTPGRGLTDTPIAGVVVRLLDSAGVEVSRTVSAANGSYSFTGLPAGVYTIVEEQPVGQPDSADYPGSGTTSLVGNDQISVTLPAGGTSNGNDFSEGAPLAGTATVRGAVYADANNDGVKDLNESGIAGVTIQLLDNANNVVGTAVTAVDGSYSFANVPAGSYRIREAQPSGWNDGIDTPGTSGTTSANDLIAVTVAAGATLVNHNFGELGARISGSVYVDANNDGVIDSGELPVAGTALSLRNADGVIVATTTTLADGTYTFGPVAAGTYTVLESQPPAYDDGKETPGAGSTTAINDQIVVTPTAGATSANNNFGELPKLPPSVISGTVYRDRGKDGALSNGDPGIEGVTVTLYNSTGAIVATAITGPSGAYEFGDLPPGTYRIVESQPGLYDDGGETAGLRASLTGNDTITVSLLGGQTSGNNNFGEVAKPGTIGGRVFVDQDNNGVMSSTSPREVPLANVMLTLKDSAGNVVATTKTDNEGIYQFLNVPPGSYTVVESQPTNADDGLDIPGANNSVASKNIIAVTLGDGASTVDNDFAELPSVPKLTPGRISGNVYVDINGNGRPDAGEPTISSVTVELVDASGVVVATKVTGPDGTYLFTNVLPGTYTVRETQPTSHGDGVDTPGNGAVVGANDAFTVTLAPGTWSEANDFAETLGSITGLVSADTNRDGTPETPVAGVTIELLDSAGVVIATTTTLADGTYRFDGLLAGDYSVREVQPPQYIDGPEAPGAGGTSSTNDVIVVRLGGGVASTGHTFVETVAPPPVVVPPVVVPQVVTPPPPYTPIIFRDPEPVVAPAVPEPPLAPVAPAPQPVTPTPPPIEPAKPAVPAPPPASPKPALQAVRGTVWLDANRDANPAGAELGAVGLKVIIRDLKGRVVAEVETDANGRWSIQLEPGEYEATPVLPAGFDATTLPKVRFSVVFGEAFEAAPIGIANVAAELALTGSSSSSSTTETGLALVGLGAVMVVAGSKRRRRRWFRRQAE